MRYTNEQQAVIDAINDADDGRIIAVNSIAGSGKTATSFGIVDTVRPKNGFYTAFNKAIVEDSKKRFEGAIVCSTLHSLAYRCERPSGIVKFGYADIEEDIPYDFKALLISLVEEFFLSRYVSLDQFIAHRVYDGQLKNCVEKYAMRYLEGEETTFSAMLKRLHLDLYYGRISLDRDLLILDECQDTTGVMLEIFRLINSPKKVILGDRFQSIYSFLHSVNAFELLRDIREYRLTKSFRCSPEIAKLVEDYGRNALEERFVFTGNEDLEPNFTTKAIITRTNAFLINAMLERMDKNKSFILTRPVDEIFNIPIQVYWASLGNQVQDRSYRFLETEYRNFQKQNQKDNFLDWLVEVLANDKQIVMSCRLLKKLKHLHTNIFDLKKRVVNLEPDPTFILTTAHAFKGLEADEVTIAGDLANFNIATRKNVEKERERLEQLYEKEAEEDDGREADGEYEGRERIGIDLIRPGLADEDLEELNIYYVAMSRARHVLLNHNGWESDFLNVDQDE